MTKCIYNNHATTINFNEDYFTVGKKKIYYSKVFAIKKDNLTNYLSLFSKNLYTFLFLSVNIIFFLVFKELNTIFILVSNLVLLLIVFYFRHVYLPKKFKDNHFILYDIVYRTHHETLIVSLADNITFNKKKLERLSYTESRFLQRYLNRIKQGRKYLFTQIESKSSAGEILYEKYITVAQKRYKDTKPFDRNVLSHFETIINENFLNIRRSTLLMFRCNLVLTFGSIIYFVYYLDTIFFK